MVALVALGLAFASGVIMAFVTAPTLIETFRSAPTVAVMGVGAAAVLHVFAIRIALVARDRRD